MLTMPLQTIVNFLHLGYIVVSGVRRANGVQVREMFFYHYMVSLHDI